MSDMWEQLRETDPELWAEVKTMEQEGRHPSPTVVIVCEDGHKLRKVQTYRRGASGDDGVWAPVTAASRRERSAGAAPYASPTMGSADAGGTRAHLLDDSPRSVKQWANVKAFVKAGVKAEDGSSSEVDARLRDALTCSSCAMRVPVRDERLQVILSGVWEAAGSPASGVSHLSLRGLDAVA